MKKWTWGAESDNNNIFYREYDSHTKLFCSSYCLTHRREFDSKPLRMGSFDWKKKPNHMEMSCSEPYVIVIHSLEYCECVKYWVFSLLQLVDDFMHFHWRFFFFLLTNQSIVFTLTSAGFLLSGTSPFRSIDVYSNAKYSNE